MKWFKILVVIIAVILISLFVIGAIFDPAGKKHTPTESGSSAKTTPIFTHLIFDPQLVSHITPLGELNGGFDEAQTIAGVMINLKKEAVAGGKQIEVIAPTDMTLSSYAYYQVGNEPPDWALQFSITPSITLKLDHINRASQPIIDATTSVPTDNSSEQHPKKKISVKAGEVIGYTAGTSLGKNWNIYLTDSGHINKFIIEKRYRGERAALRVLTARCPFDFYSSELKEQLLPLFGATKAGQSADCGSVSSDVAGTLSGMWHFDENPSSGIEMKQDGEYLSPLSIYKNSAGEIIIDRVNNKRQDIYPNNPTNKDPATITGEHCYQLDSGYAFFKLTSDRTMQLVYSASGSCPSIFPEKSARIYNR